SEMTIKNGAADLLTPRVNLIGLTRRALRRPVGCSASTERSPRPRSGAQRAPCNTIYPGFSYALWDRTSASSWAHIAQANRAYRSGITGDEWPKHEPDDDIETPLIQPRWWADGRPSSTRVRLASFTPPDREPRRVVLDEPDLFLDPELVGESLS